ncbi:MAG: EAL domain-containing protein [Deltaproteobacteria bacterium]|nr:EAL domain-containing protein [Deltaproteobacteria bacterium]MBZ0220630.1 EAL domain-containing protein [Deltaproteobacteria bacterium]
MLLKKNPENRLRLSVAFSTLRGRLVSLVLLASLPLFALIVYTNIEQRRNDSEEARQSVLSVVRQASKEQVKLIQDTRLLLSVLSQSVGAVSGEDLALVLRNTMEYQKVYANIGLIGTDGMLLASALPFDSALYLGDRPYFQRAIRDLDFSIGDYQVGRITSVPGLNFSYPVFGRDGSLSGVLFAALPITWIWDALLADGPAPGSVITAVDGTGTVLARFPEGSEWTGKSIEGTELAELLNSRSPEDHAVISGLDGIKRIYAFNEIGLGRDSRIFVAYGIPVATAYAEADRALIRNILTSGAVIIAALLMAVFWGDRLVLNRIRGLVGATRKIGEGALDTRADVHGGNDEIDSLARSFNSMAEALERREEEAQLHLERIARLNRIYSVLSAINGTIIRARDRDHLLNEACRIAVEHGGFALAWVALKDENGRLYPAAHAGRDKEYIDALVPFLDPSPGKPMPFSLMAVVNDRHMIGTDFEKETALAPWKELAKRYGYRSIAAFPLRTGGEAKGALCLYSAEPGFFNDSEEIALLLELAADTSLGLQNIEKEERLDFLSRYDTLTGLSNRWVFEDRLGHAVQRARYYGRSVGVVTLDIAGFRKVNDTLGHRAGDELLKHIAGYLSRSTRDGDTVSRLGNDNFGLVLADAANRDDIVTVLERIVEGLPHMVPVGGEEIVLNAAVGVSVYPDDGGTAAELMRNSALAVHSRADSAPDKTASYYSPEINRRAQERRTIENELRHALSRGELELVYQPIMAIAGRKPAGAEALIRWKSKKLGPVPPDKFIPVAEDTGLIIPIGDWVVQTALGQARSWKELGIELEMGVNVSVCQLKDPGFPERLEEITKSGNSAEGLRFALEVTESGLMDDISRFSRILDRLRSIGVRIYIDDFGTGYSSLSYLNRLPVDILKIDRSFIQDLASDAGSMTMARGIIAMAASLELGVIAEGVETEAQLRLLEEYGCDFVQGYYFGKPGRPSEIEPLLRTGLTGNI